MGLTLDEKKSNCNPVEFGVSIYQASEQDPVMLRVKSVITSITEHYGLYFNDLKSTYRGRNKTEAMQLAMYFLFKHTGLQKKQIGKLMGGRDHSTVIYAINTVEDLIETDKNFKEVFIKLSTSITNKVIKIIQDEAEKEIINKSL